MRELGARLALDCRAGDVIVLEGELGAGKTTLVQGIAAGLGIDEPITSPTFVIARVHRSSGRVGLVHVDAYRLTTLADVDDLDLPMEEAVTVVEWGAGLGESLSPEYLDMRIVRREDDVREVFLSGTERWRDVCAALDPSAECR